MFAVLSTAITVMMGTLLTSPAKATDWNTCNTVGFSYLGGGLDGLTGSAPGLVQDSNVFGTNSSSADCQINIGGYDSTMLESVAHTGTTFNFGYTGNYLADSASCMVSVKLNNKVWIEDNTQYFGESSAQRYHFITEILSETEKSLFASLTDIGNNEITVTSICPGYEQANVTLTANLKIVQDSFNDFEGVSINDGAEFSNSRDVNVNLSFVTGVIGQVMISNDGGFPSSQREIVEYSKNTIPWTLNATRDERMVKTIYVKYKLVNRYTGTLESTWSQTISDDIILDTIKPIIKTVSAADQSVSAQGVSSLRSAVKLQSVKVNLSASDNKSGVGKLQYSTKKSATGAVTKTYSKAFSASLNPKISTLYLRVQDNAGNWSTWKTISITKKYSNCKALNKVYPGGVAKSSKAKNKGGKTKYQPKVDAKLYKANSTKDRDKDGIACER
jgi:hypothetical protein